MICMALSGMDGWSAWPLGPTTLDRSIPVELVCTGIGRTLKSSTARHVVNSDQELCSKDNWPLSSRRRASLVATSD